MKSAKQRLISTQISEGDKNADLSAYIQAMTMNKNLESLGELPDEIIMEEEGFKSMARKELDRRDVMINMDKTMIGSSGRNSSTKKQRLSRKLKSIANNPLSYVSMKNLNTPRRLKVSKQTKMKTYKRSNLSIITSGKASQKKSCLRNSKSMNFRINSSYLVTEIKPQQKKRRKQMVDKKRDFDENCRRNLWNIYDTSIIEIKKKLRGPDRRKNGPTLSDRCLKNRNDDFKNQLFSLKKKYSKTKKTICYKKNEEINALILDSEIPFTLKSETDPKFNLKSLKNSPCIANFKPLNSYRQGYKKGFDDYKEFIAKILKNEDKPLLSQIISDKKIKMGVVDELANKGRFELIIRTSKYVKKNPKLSRNFQNFQNLAKKLTDKISDGGKEKKRLEKVVGSLMSIQETRDKYDVHVRQ